MKNAEELKTIVKKKYGEIALMSPDEPEASACCGTGCCGAPHGLTCFNDDYTGLTGYHKDADLKLGCGVPTETAAIKSGDTVLDLGSGAGNDAFVARAMVGDFGRVIGLDITESMIEKARKNSLSLGYANVDFRLGDIESMPVDDASIDVVISNCVLNLVPDKRKAFGEIRRVLKKNGHFSVSDIVLARSLPDGLASAAEMYAGCVSGALEQSEYLRIILDSGFRNVEVKIEKPIHLPDEILARYLPAAEIEEFKAKGAPIKSVTVFGEK